MIDTEKYEGHSKGWVLEYGDAVGLVYPDESSVTLDADQHLITDAPLLLEEVQRLREQIRLLHDTWFADEEMASDVDERMTILLKEMIE